MVNAIANEIGLILPRYMVTMIMIFPIPFRPEVRFLVSPTVAVALAVSYIISRALLSGVTAASKTVDRNKIAKDMDVTATALFTALLGMFL